jgi:hypothetical protein
VSAFAEIEKGLPRQLALLDRYRLDRDARAPDERFGLTHPLRDRVGFQQPWTIRHGWRR